MSPEQRSGERWGVKQWEIDRYRDAQQKARERGEIETYPEQRCDPAKERSNGR